MRKEYLISFIFLVSCSSAPPEELQQTALAQTLTAQVTNTPTPSPTSTNTPVSKNTPTETYCPPPPDTPEITCGSREEWAVTPPFTIKAPWPKDTTWIAGGTSEDMGNYFCDRTHNTATDKFAIDFNGDDDSDKGALVLAVAKGIVFNDTEENEDIYGIGHYVIILHGDFDNYCYVSVYGHLEKQLCLAGTEVPQGSAIGIVGKSGDADGYHLHFAMRRIPMDEIKTCDYAGISNWLGCGVEPVRPVEFDKVLISRGKQITSTNRVIECGE